MDRNDRMGPSVAPPRAGVEPPSRNEVKVLQSARYKPSELERFRAHATSAGLSYTAYMREATLIGDRVLYADVVAGVHVRATA